jgi:hypothetical protein
MAIKLPNQHKKCKGKVKFYAYIAGRKRSEDEGPASSTLAKTAMLKWEGMGAEVESTTEMMIKIVKEIHWSNIIESRETLRN